MPKINICGLLCIVAFAVSTSVAQKTYTPEKNSPERAAIFAALRVPVAKELKQPVSFLANDCKVQGNWAFISGQAQSKNGGKVNWKITEYRENIENGAFDDNLFALLRKTGGEWRVVTYAVGCTDICWVGWDEQYKAPAAIFK